MTTRGVQARLAAAYKVDVSPELISKISDSVLPLLREWQARPLDAMYPVMYLDAIVVKVRTDGRVTNRPVYIAMAIGHSWGPPQLRVAISTGVDAEQTPGATCEGAARLQGDLVGPRRWVERC